MVRSKVSLIHKQTKLYFKGKINTHTIKLGKERSIYMLYFDSLNDQLIYTSAHEQVGREADPFSLEHRTIWTKQNWHIGFEFSKMR